jgi:hypothetical protein
LYSERSRKFQQCCVPFVGSTADAFGVQISAKVFLQLSTKLIIKLHPFYKIRIPTNALSLKAAGESTNRVDNNNNKNNNNNNNNNSVLE